MGATLQLWVGEGNGAVAREWYERLLGRPPDFRPFDDDSFVEWQFPPGLWEIHIVAKDPAGTQRARFRFGVSDLILQRERLERLGIETTEIGELPDVVKWCDFDDEWGNRLGLYQDLSRYR